ncbi:MAG: hypothetical protein EP330_22885 [Deltaproteobacteria bacterium]|nr:MAG: hypothetical protein EP330_22885 [Deltaproteobacteria bacterium]
MLYEEEKRREMARSILPSTSRSAAKNKARIRRANRRKTRQALKQWLRDELPERVDLRAEDRHLTRWVVQSRRGADKVNPFIRWATAVTAGLPVEDRLSAVRGMLPRGLIGEHALSHLAWTEHFRPPHAHLMRPAFRPWRVRALERVARVWPSLGQVHHEVDRLLRLRHSPVVYRFPWNDGMLVATETAMPPSARRADWLEVLDRAARRYYWWNRDLRCFTRAIGDTVVCEGQVFALTVVEEQTERHWPGWMRRPDAHPEWLATAWGICWLWESGERDFALIEDEVVHHGSRLPAALRRELRGL